MAFTPELFSSYLLAFGIIFLAEMGDKSQLVCMTLASRHKARQVALGTITAFSLLNLLAVTVGKGLTHFIPQNWLTLTAAGLFVIFGLQTLLQKEDNKDTDGNNEKTDKNIFFKSFMMIFFSELGDKTQLAVITLSATFSPFSVWLLSTLALSTTSLIGIYAGRKFLSRISIHWLHRINGIFFILLAILLVMKRF